MRRVLRRLLTACLVLSLLLAGIPFTPSIVAAEPETLSMQNGCIEVTVSTVNGGFAVRTLEGDFLTKDDNNKDLLFRRSEYDTSFASFLVASAAGQETYVFGNDYSYLGWQTELDVQQEANGIRAIWTVNDLVFTQMLEPVSNEQSNEHGTVRISYSVENQTGEPIAVFARLLLDTALGAQDYAFYELAQPPTADDPFVVMEREVMLSSEEDCLPANFFAYDNYQSPTIAAYTIFDQAEGTVAPSGIAFGHWNNLAASAFNFYPDDGLTFTNPYNRRYLTADSAFALYYDLGAVEADGLSSEASTYYGVDSKVRVKDGDRVGVTVTAPPALTLAADKLSYLPGSKDVANSVFQITTNITNLNRPDAALLPEVTVAVLVDDGLHPLDGGGNEISPQPTNKEPYNVVLGNLAVGGLQSLVWNLRADVLPETSYRGVTFRAYDTSGTDKLLLENLIGSATAYVLCPGGDGDLPPLTFTSIGPRAVYNQGTRHLFVTGSGFGTYLEGAFSYELVAYPKDDSSATGYKIPLSNLIFPPDEPGVMEVVLEQELPPGEYQLGINWQGGAAPFGDQSIRPPALSFLVTQDPAYRNDYYGIIAVVKGGSKSNPTYAIQAFTNEQTFAAFDGEVLLEFRGKFTITSTGADGEILACSAVASSARDTVTVNGALDFEQGNVQIYRLQTSDDGVMVEFNGDLYTSNSRTSVWSGNASLTPLTDGADYGLIKYNQRGERILGKQPQNAISLVWPSGYNMLQTIGGFAVDFRYGQFGAMYTDNEATERTGYVVSFGGKLDLSFLLPGGSKQAEELEDDDGTDTSGSGGSVTVSPSEQAKAENEQNKVKPVGKVNIEDVLFGNGDGYLGFNSQAELMLPKYVQPLPAMGGKLSINTIGGYKVGVLGKAKTKKFELEFELKVQNHPNSNAPIPDKLYFYMAGFEPGVNVDGAGAFWLTGAGGGIDKLYDTIFKSGVPPLTVLLSASFDVVKVMSGRADLALSLRGFQMKLTDVKLKNTDKVIVKSGQLGVEWEPDLYLQLSAMAEILEIIEGRTYLVVDDDFFEMFLRASVKVPKDVKIIGDMTIGNVDLGGNNDKIWGTISALGVRLGVTYYWGGDVRFGSGANNAKPTYPELLGMPNVPVGTDAETGETLYLRVGTNLSEEIPAQVVSDDEAEQPVLLAIEPTLKSRLDKRTHTLNLGDSSDDAALAIRFAGVVENAQSLVTISDPLGQPYALSYYSDGADPNAANANVVVSGDGKSTTVYVTITDYVAGVWQIETAAEADVVLYMVGALPTMAFTRTYISWGNIGVDWTGTELEGTQVSFYLTETDAYAGGELGSFVGSAAADSLQCIVAPPADLPVGEYYLQAVLSKQNLINQSMLVEVGGQPYVYSKAAFFAPASPKGVQLVNCGNSLFELKIAEHPAAYSFQGYRVNIYEQTADGLLPSDLMGMEFAKDSHGVLPQMTFGGSYLSTDGLAFGLQSGKTYLAEVSAYAEVGGDLYFSQAAWSDPCALRTATTPQFYFVPQAAHQLVSKTIRTAAGVQEINVSTFTERNVRFTLNTDAPVSGHWTIDGALPADAASPDGSKLSLVDAVTSILVDQTLCDGEHVLSFTGTTAEGDGFVYSKLFAVDTMPPRLMLSSPVNGSTFGADGSLHVQGIGDAESIYTIRVDEQTVASGLRLATTADGLFSYQLSLDPGVVSHRVEVIAADAVGNNVSASATVTNSGLAEIEKVNILLDGAVLGADPAERNLGDAFQGRQVQLDLLATTTSGQDLLIRDQRLVRWTASTKSGSATVDEDGELLVAPGSVGFVVGELLVADGGSIDSSLTFGAENFSGAQRHLVVTSSTGGSAKGGGAYLPNAQVPITATAEPGYRFVEWVSDAGGAFGDAHAAATAFTMPDVNALITARFEVDPATALTVTFETNGGSPIAHELVAPGGRAMEPASFPDRAGHQFVEWCGDSALSIRYDFSHPVTGDVTLYAKWQINNYNVSFVDWDGRELKSEVVAWHQAATPPATAERVGYALVGWDKAFDCVESDLIVTARYEPTFTVTFQSNGGSAVPGQVVVENGLAVGPAWPHKAGYSFAGWYADPALTIPYDFGQAITGDVTLYARWLEEDEPEPARTVISRFAQTTDDRRLDEAIRQGQATIGMGDDDQAVLSIGVLHALSGAGLPLTLGGQGVSLGLPANWLDTASLSDQSLVRISARQLDDDAEQVVLANGSSSGPLTFDICGQIYELSVQIISRNAGGGISESAVSHFLQPVRVTIDLRGLGLTVEDAVGLTGARLEQDGQGRVVPTKLGGEYELENGSFTFNTDQFSHYAVIKPTTPRWVITLQTATTQAVVNGEVLPLDVPPALINGRTMVPVRFLAEAMGAEVSWSATTGVVSIQLRDLQLTLRIGELAPEAGLDVPAQLVQGRTLVPLRYVGESLGATVTWSETDNSVRIVKP